MEDAKEKLTRWLGEGIWDEVAVPALQQRLALLSQEAVTNGGLDLVRLAELRSEYRAVLLLLRDPVAFLLPKEGGR